MIELIYCSNAEKNIEHQDILDILEISQKFNLSNSITGCLVYYNNEFIQILEGENNVINDLFSRIKKDRRHRNVSLLYTSEIKEKQFKEWSMAFLNLSDNESLNIQKELFVENLRFLSEHLQKDSKASKLFWALVIDVIKK